MFDYCGIARTSFPIFEDVCTFVGHVLPAHQNLTFFLHPTCLPYVCWAVSGKHCQANILMWTHRTGANITKSTTRTQAFRSLSVCAYVCIRRMCILHLRCVRSLCYCYTLHASLRWRNASPIDERSMWKKEGWKTSHVARLCRHCSSANTCSHALTHTPYIHARA